MGVDVVDDIAGTFLAGQRRGYPRMTQMPQRTVAMTPVVPMSPRDGLGCRCGLVHDVSHSCPTVAVIQLSIVDDSISHGKRDSLSARRSSKEPSRPKESFLSPKRLQLQAPGAARLSPAPMEILGLSRGSWHFAWRRCRPPVTTTHTRSDLGRDHLDLTPQPPACHAISKCRLPTPSPRPAATNR